MQLIQNQKFTTPQFIEGDTHITHCEITGDMRGVEGAFMCRNYAKLWIDYCIIHDIVGSGIVLRSTGKGSGARIRHNTIYNVSGNGVIAKAGEAVNEDAEISWNTFDNVGYSDLRHPIYAMSPDVLIEHNEIYKTSGDGITMRSTGKIRWNRIRGAGKSSIKYFSDGTILGLSNTVVIEGNECDGSGLGHAGISLQKGSGLRASRYVIKGNEVHSYAEPSYSFGVEFKNIELS